MMGHLFLKEGKYDYAASYIELLPSIHFQATGIVPPTLHLSIPSSMDISSWMLKGSILTSSLQLWEDPFPQNNLNNQSDPKWTLDPNGLLCHLDASISELWQSPNTCSQSTCTTIPLQVISVRQNPSSSSYAILWSRTPSLHQGLLQIMHHCSCTKPVCPQTLQTSQATSNSQEALEFHIHGFHREAPFHLLVTPWF